MAYFGAMTAINYLSSAGRQNVTVTRIDDRHRRAAEELSAGRSQLDLYNVNQHVYSTLQSPKGLLLGVAPRGESPGRWEL